ncbi:hypothetical protein SNEBB_003103 [Seison nebaliae]|nr:hypothetical protein SNEBB_003103 [Seison nebaliae]
MISPQLKLILEYDGQLHDRRIELDNGIVVSMGRGLDYFQKTTRHSIQFHETELRRCKKTVIDIYWK